MTSFLHPFSIHPSSILRLKPRDITRSKHRGAIYLPFFSPLGVLPSSHYTRIDQALLVWSVTVTLIFVPAQFLCLDWTLQALLWSIVSAIAIYLTHHLTWPMPQYRYLRWVMLLWTVLMLLGVGITDYGVFTHHGWILSHMCDIWLSVCAVGYFISSIGMRSLPLLIIGGFHGLAILVLMVIPQWSFLLTGLVMAWSLLILAEFWWEHE